MFPADVRAHIQGPHTISPTPVPADFNSNYRGRLAPSPTGLLHLGHARTFWTAAQRAAQHHGPLILRNEDLDPQRCKPEFVRAMYEDLHWLGIEWTEGPDRGGPFAPYSQSERRPHYLAAWKSLRGAGRIYPCTCSRKDVAQSPSAPHENDTDDDPIYPGHCRPTRARTTPIDGKTIPSLVETTPTHGVTDASSVPRRRSPVEPIPTAESSTQSRTPIPHPPQTGASASPTAKKSASPTSTSAPNSSSPAAILEISLSGAATTSLLTNSPSSSTTRPCKSPKSSAAPTC